MKKNKYDYFFESLCIKLGICLTPEQKMLVTDQVSLKKDDFISFILNLEGLDFQKNNILVSEIGTLIDVYKLYEGKSPNS